VPIKLSQIACVCVLRLQHGIAVVPSVGLYSFLDLLLLTPILFYFFSNTLGLIKSFAGAAAGAVVGMVLFRSGGGMRAASTAMGVGVAWGSTYERATAASKSS